MIGKCGGAGFYLGFYRRSPKSIVTQTRSVIIIIIIIITRLVTRRSTGASFQVPQSASLYIGLQLSAPATAKTLARWLLCAYV